jgi:hypothetical protein
LYVGKIGTGILWLVTGGLFGIGQLIDVMRLFSGTFTDARGRRLLVWEDERELGDDSRVREQAALLASNPGMQLTPQAASASSSSSWSSRGSAMTRHALGLLSALAGLLIFVGIALGAATALDLPRAVQAGVFGPQAAVDIRDDVFGGYEAWPSLAQRVGMMIMSLTLLIAVVVQIFARRPCGVSHQLRGVLGTGGLLLAVFALGDAFRAQTAWVEIAAHRHLAGMIDAFLSQWNGGKLMGAAALFLVAIFLLAWPPQRRQGRTSHLDEHRPAMPENLGG